MLARLCLLTLLAMCSCAATSQQKANPAAPCFQALSSDPRFAPIREKVALGGDTVDQMRRMTKSLDRASQQEGAVLAAWRNAREECHQLEVPYFATRDSQIEALAQEHFAAVQALIPELQGGALTYGEFGKRRMDLYEKAISRMEKVRQSVIPPNLPPHSPGK